ncbi:M15 family metallopeptidase [Bacillaceae bacterium Marseille-Q3522]|nr:M15 family metallopeptidase [Bacillaceae bacterium Marseille-Q3522]
MLILIAAGTLFYFFQHDNNSAQLTLQKLQEGPRPTGLHPVVAENRDKLVERANAIGISIVITDDFRSFEEQDKLYAQGRTTEGNIVTNAEAGESLHNYGLAIDFALQLASGEVIWDMEYDGNHNGKSDWLEVVDIAKELGFEWGGDWSGFKDYPHLQMIPDDYR